MVWVHTGFFALNVSGGILRRGDGLLDGSHRRDATIIVKFITVHPPEVPVTGVGHILHVCAEHYTPRGATLGYIGEGDLSTIFNSM